MNEGIFIFFCSEMIEEKRIKIVKITEDFSISDFENEKWKLAEEVLINKYWSSEIAPIGRHFKTRILWSETALYVRFEANQTEPLVISETPNLSSKTNGLWERDVCEIFLAPDPQEFRKYFEFEIAPTGEWIDLAIYQMPNQRETNFEYKSGIQTAAKIGDNQILMAFKVEWIAFGNIPKTGEIWKGNILRCIGKGETRGYLTWQPTETEKPNFHVPEKFGEFWFVR